MAKKEPKYIIAGIMALALVFAAYFLFFRKSARTEIAMPAITESGGEAAIQEENIESDKSAEIPKLEAEEKDTNIPNEASNDKSGSLEIISKNINWGFEKNFGRKIDTIIVHSSYDALGQDPYSVDGILDEYKMYGVSAHYLIDRDGNIYRLVDEKNIAYHAGQSQVPDGRTGVNAFSLGIEMINTKTGEFTEKQYDALNALIKDIKSRYSIKYVLGHNQVAPGRKDDPWNINWSRVKK